MAVEHGALDNVPRAGQKLDVQGPSGHGPGHRDHHHSLGIADRLTTVLVLCIQALLGRTRVHCGDHGLHRLRGRVPGPPVRHSPLDARGGNHRLHLPRPLCPLSTFSQPMPSATCSAGGARRGTPDTRPPQRGSQPPRRPAPRRWPLTESTYANPRSTAIPEDRSGVPVQGGSFCLVIAWFRLVTCWCDDRSPSCLPPGPSGATRRDPSPMEYCRRRTSRDRRSR